MHNDGTSAGRVGEFDPPDEGQEASSMVGHAMVRPASEMELFNFTDLIVSPLCKDQNRAIKDNHGYENWLTMKKHKKFIKNTAFAEKGCWHGLRAYLYFQTTAKERK